MAEDHIATRRAPDRSRRARIAVSVLGIVGCIIMTLTFQEKSLGLLFGLAFSLAWWSEVARRLPVLMALGAVAGAAFVRVLGGHKAARQSHGVNTAAYR
jgi:hypothetical protein